VTDKSPGSKKFHPKSQEKSNKSRPVNTLWTWCRRSLEKSTKPWAQSL